MANLTSYSTNSTPKSSDLLLGTKVANPNTDEQPVTMNFAVSDIASFANSYSLGYTVYTALITQAGTAAPVATIMQNTTGKTFTWARTGSGTYTITANGSAFTSSKTIVFYNLGEYVASSRYPWVRTSDTVITISLGGDGRITNGSFEIRIYS